MPHLVLLGDSVLDNAAYTAGGPPVIDQVAQRLPAGWKATLCAVDGSMSDDIGAQLARLPPDATHLLLSVGGNDALMRADVLQAPVAVSGEAFALLHAAATDFEAAYRRMLDACLARGGAKIADAIVSAIVGPADALREARLLRRPPPHGHGR